MFNPQIKKKGRMAKVKSQMTEIALYVKVRPMMMSIFTQVPLLMDLSQKKAIGVHCRRVARKKMSPVRTVRPIAV